MKITNIFEFFEKCSTQKTLINYLQEFNIIKTLIDVLVAMRCSIIKTKQVKDGYMFRCPSKCLTSSIREGSFFQNRSWN
jgi:hypothetical protein